MTFKKYNLDINFFLVLLHRLFLSFLVGGVSFIFVYLLFIFFKTYNIQYRGGIFQKGDGFNSILDVPYLAEMTWIGIPLLTFILIIRKIYQDTKPWADDPYRFSSNKVVIVKGIEFNLPEIKNKMAALGWEIIKDKEHVFVFTKECDFFSEGRLHAPLRRRKVISFSFDRKNEGLFIVSCRDENILSVADAYVSSYVCIEGLIDSLVAAKMIHLPDAN